MAIDDPILMHAADSSSNVHSFGYDRESQTLVIYFLVKQKGVIVGTRRYEYYDVPAEVYRGLAGADSKGTYVWAHIRDRYDFSET